MILDNISPKFREHARHQGNIWQGVLIADWGRGLLRSQTGRWGGGDCNGRPEIKGGEKRTISFNTANVPGLRLLSMKGQD